MTKPKLLKNSLSLLVNRLTQGIATFILTTVIARNLGAYELGQYILAISYYYIFVTFVGQGLRTLFTRELAREAEATPVYLVSGTFLQLILSIIGYVLLVCVVFLLPYNADTSLVCYIMGLAVIPFALSNITEAIFQAQENMHLIAITTVPIYILRLVVMIWLINLDYSINHIAGIMVISEILILLIQWVFLVRKIKPAWQIDQDFMRKSLYSVRTFFAINASGIVAGKMDVLLISLLGSEFLVGLYGMIAQLMQPFLIVSNSVSIAAFPLMSKAVNLGKEKQQEETENVVEILLAMSIPFAMGVSFFANELLILIYNDSKFLEASLPLQINVLTLVAAPFIRSFGYLLVANGLEKYNLFEVLITTVSGGVSGVVLISQYKLIGAALMKIVMSVSACGLLTYAVYSRLFSLNLWRIMRRPLLISGLMLIIFLLLKKINLDFLLTLIISTLTYIVLICLVFRRDLGGFNSIRQKFSLKK
ncbi:oligosaccharide flippase family protein [Nodularia harveyana UHCC-0300]|uniref:Oligosaccharide flippase family protein n=1 Tax=Nodularia harveyana UHCC-0300 TaxID=2974287 RepID=A0ABU5UAT6_9CYAN|nr:oligosaccharide flippase family protein [Nodularia harveyana]MEA5580245.1 oligosaccharide flippase family protein [Nodularia harveyana UHCC-0300]